MIDVIVVGDFSPLNRIEDSLNRGDYSFLNHEDINNEDALLIVNFESVIAPSDNKKIKKVEEY